ncbi:MAG: hypothetical protein JJU37_16340 [Balneolaceae bacterium]|nr:hypothetical protein [Balneolaceae bacterium]
MKKVLIILLSAAALTFVSCSLFLSDVDDPGVAEHGYISGVSPTNTATFRNRVYPTVKANWPGPGGDKVWLALNLGATDKPTSSVDSNSSRSGWYFQFNRSQAYHHNGSQLTPQWRVNSIDQNTDWEPQNDPCRLLLAEPWRLPTVEELRAFREAPIERGGMGEGNRTSAFNSTLQLHAAGSLHSFSGDLRDRGSSGSYWASDQFNSRNGEAFAISETGSGTFGGNKAFGRSVRCIKD